MITMTEKSYFWVNAAKQQQRPKKKKKKNCTFHLTLLKADSKNNFSSFNCSQRGSVCVCDNLCLALHVIYLAFWCVHVLQCSNLLISRKLRIWCLLISYLHWSYLYCFEYFSYLITRWGNFVIFLFNPQIDRSGRIPMLRFRNRDSYTQNKTKEYDDMAMKYLSYVLFLLVACSSIYSLMYERHRSWYSWILSSLTSCVYMFGKIVPPKLLVLILLLVLLTRLVNLLNCLCYNIWREKRKKEKKNPTRAFLGH